MEGTAAWDVVVVGGGPAGAAAARVLAREGRRVLVLEASEYGQFRPGESLPPRANGLFARLGIADKIVESGQRPAVAVWSAWGDDPLVETSYLRSPHGDGLHVDRGKLDALLAEAAEEAGAVVRRGRRAAGVARRGEEIVVSVSAGAAAREEEPGCAQEVIRARWVVDASGRRAIAARRLGATRVLHDRLIGVISTLRTGSPAGDEAEVLVLEAREHGWFYSVPLPAAGPAAAPALLAAFLCDRDTLVESGLDPRAFWEAALAGSAHTRRRAAGYPHVEAVRVRSAASAYLTRVTGDGWVAAGDAAAGFDPLAAQGICRALEQGIAAGLAVHAALSGDLSKMAEYEERHRRLVATYLAERGRSYALERRWPEARFWRRRAAADRAIGLDPEARVAAVAAPPTAALDAAEAFLSPAEVQALITACAAPAPSHVVLGRLRGPAAGRAGERLAGASDERLILGLQRLIAGGACVVVSGDER